MHAAIPRVVGDANERISVGVVGVLAVAGPVEAVSGRTLLERVGCVTNAKYAWKRVVLHVLEIAVVDELDGDAASDEGREFDALPDTAVEDGAVVLAHEIDGVARLDRFVGVDARDAVEEILVPLLGSFWVWLEASVDIGFWECVAEDLSAIHRLQELVGGLVRLRVREAGEEDKCASWGNECGSDLVIAGVVARARAAITIFGGWGAAVALFETTGQQRIFRQGGGEGCGLEQDCVKEDAEAKSENVQQSRLGEPGMGAHLGKIFTGCGLVSRSYPWLVEIGSGTV